MRRKTYVLQRSNSSLPSDITDRIALLRPVGSGGVIIGGHMKTTLIEDLKNHTIIELGSKALPVFVLTRMLENNRTLSEGRCLIANLDGSQYGLCPRPNVECVDCLKALQYRIGKALYETEEPKE